MRARGRFFFNWLSARKERTISGSTCLRDVRALRIHRGGMFARNLRYPRTTEPALDEKSLAFLGMESSLLVLQKWPSGCHRAPRGRKEKKNAASASRITDRPHTRCPG